MPYIGLDVGTSGAKASVVDAAGNILAHHSVEYPTLSPGPGYFEVDARVVLAGVLQVLQAVARPDITALSIASFGEALVLLDAEDAVLANSIYYNDIRGSAEVADFLAGFDAARARAITGTRANPMYSACKLLWMQKHRPELLQKARRILLFGDFITYMLTGRQVVDYSLASRTMLFDVKKKAWSAQLFAAFGLELEKFSAPVPTGAAVGPLTAKMAARLGLPKDLLVVAGGHDKVLAALGGGCVQPGDCVDGMGSSESINMMLKGEAWTQKMADYNFCCEPYVFENSYLTLAFNASSGTALRWYRDCFAAERAAALAAEGGSIYAALDAECPKEPTELLFLPHVAGSGTPFLDSSLGGAALGLRVNTTGAQLYKAVLEGMCFEMQYNLELFRECGLAPGVIHSVGGGSKSDVLMQIKADIMDRELHTLRVNETGTLGLALLCAKAVGDITDLAREAGRLQQIRRVYRPDPARAAVYKKQMERYRKIYPAMQEIFGR